MVGKVVRPRAVLVVVLWLQGTLLVAAQTVETTSIATPSTYYSASHALLIGINKYPKLPADVQLAYAVQDVDALKSVLINRYGFPRKNIQILTDGEATRSNIELALAMLADSNRVKPNDRILIYFSGHGQTVKLPTGSDMGFLIPHDGEVDFSDTKNAGPFLATCLRMDTIWGYLESSPAKHTLVIADACYSGLLTRARGGRREFSTRELSNLRAMQVITGGDRGQRTIENSNWGHGAFTFKLLEELKARATTPGTVFTASALHASVAKSVAALTDSRQTPLLGNYKSDDGDFLFVTTAGQSSGPGKHTILVDTIPHGAKIYLDNLEQKGIVTPTDIEIDIGTAKNKKVEIAAELPGYKTAVRSVTITSGRETLLPIIGLVKAAIIPPAPSSAGVSVEPGFAPLFTGLEEQLIDWTAIDSPGFVPGGFTLEPDGSLKSFGGMGTFWYMKKPFGDFVLRLEWKASSRTSNSGVYVRCPQPQNAAKVPEQTNEIQILDEFPNDPDGRTGAIWRVKPSSRIVSTVGQWNRMEIQVSGQHYVVTINDQIVCVHDSNRSLLGYIGLQYFTKKNDPVWFRNIRIRTLL